MGKLVTKNFMTTCGEQRADQGPIENRQPVDRWRPTEFIAAAKQCLRQRAVEQGHESHRSQDVPGEAVVFADDQHQLLHFT